MIESEVQHHAIIHMEGSDPILTKKEKERWSHKISTNDAFTVVPTTQGVKKFSLAPASRIRFDNTYPVRYTLRVLIIGRVITTHRDRLKKRWRAADSS